MKIQSITFILLIAGFSVVASAASVADILNKMTLADQALNYEGVFVLRKSDRLTSMKVSHGTDQRGIWESLESLNGEARKIVRINDDVTSIYPERKLITLSHNKDKVSLHPALPQNLDKLEAYYRISHLKHERIANHETAVIEVTPNDKYRYGYRYWMDTRTGVLLKCDLMNEDGRVVEQMMFTTLEYLPKPPDEAFSLVKLEGYEKQKLDKGRNDVEKPGWQVTSLPTGFMLTQSSERKNKNRDALHLVYSDGLASVSVFIEQGENSNHRLDGASSMGVLNAYGIRVGDYNVTVMGEVPATTVMQMARSTRLLQN